MAERRCGRDGYRDDNYREESKKGKINEGVIDDYVGSSIYSVSEIAKEKDLCEPIHIEIETSVEVRKGHDIQLESATGEYT